MLQRENKISMEITDVTDMLSRMSVQPMDLSDPFAVLKPEKERRVTELKCEFFKRPKSPARASPGAGVSPKKNNRRKKKTTTAQANSVLDESVLDESGRT
jgi:hypothetical protein